MADVSRQSQVSLTSISRWMKKYSSNYEQGVRLIIEKESDSRKLLDLAAGPCITKYSLKR